MIALATFEREVANDPFNGHCLQPSQSRGCFPSSGTIKSGYILICNSGGFERCLLGAPGSVFVFLAFLCLFLEGPG